MKKPRWHKGFFIGLFLLLFVTDLAAESDPYRLGMTLDELNEALSQTGKVDTVLKVDLAGSKTVLPYNPTKALEIPGGLLTSIFLMKKSEGRVGIGQLFGYLYEGKLFCRVELFRDNPLFSSQTVVSNLKKKYPEGKIFRIVIGPTPFTYFEYLSNSLYVFSNEQGVYTCEPNVLKRVVQEARKDINVREQKEREEMRESSRTP